MVVKVNIGYSEACLMFISIIFSYIPTDVLVD